jgi:hypothetical protein
VGAAAVGPVECDFSGSSMRRLSLGVSGGLNEAGVMAGGDDDYEGVAGSKGVDQPRSTAAAAYACVDRENMADSSRRPSRM